MKGTVKRSILAIVIAVVTMAVLAGSADLVMERAMSHAFDAKGFSADPTVLSIMLAYVTAFSGLGGWIAALISRRTDLRDVLILAGLQFVMSTISSVMLFDRRLFWYYLLTIVLPVLAIVAGGWLRINRGSHSRAQEATA
jgi:hypothetical protein